MKRNIRKNLFGWLAATMLLGATSCKDDTFSNLNGEMGDEVRVSFKLAPEGAVASGRANTASTISDGSKADVLIYAVYDEEGNLLDEYGMGSSVAGVEAGPGQTVLRPEGGFPMDVTITLKRGEKYQLAFWAMSSKAKNAYITEDLKKIEVNYSQVTEETSTIDAGTDNSSSTPNNDEYRDAFCRSITLVAGENGGVQQNIHLYRPLAQINVGTNGFDYEIATRETQTKYTYSKIRINRVARYLDVVADRTYTSTTSNEETTDKTPEAFAVVDFGWAPIPAYSAMHPETDVYDVTVPVYPSYSKWNWLYNDAFVLNRDGKTIDKSQALGDDGISGIYGKEYFLTVHRDLSSKPKTMPEVKDQDVDNDGYRDYADLTSHNNKESETFKYLSMCYVLTSSTEENPVVINNVKVWLASDANGADEYELLNINQVPAQRNWRTNIIGNLLTEENNFEVKLDRDFAGEFSGWGPNWQWTGPLAEGLFYDGANDVIEISSKEGLLNFQRLVNGTIKVREAADTKMVGKDYQYYSSTGQTLNFVYNGISKPADADLAQRIMVATHQNTRIDASWSDDSWPAGNNFHFTGRRYNEETGKYEDYPATVRLMCDIDLSGEEWIPIGFEGRIGEQLGWTILDDTYSANDKNASNRVFYGIFDGNGHTISNLYTKRFSANVHETAQQIKGYRKVYTTDTRHPSDNPQWFARGLFGQVGGNAKVTNVRLNNPDIYGCNGVAGIVGVAYGDAIEISNNVVEGGSIVATPMYRGDSYKTTAGEDFRTFARGVYMGGIVGYFNTDGGKVDNNIVRNVYMSAVRRAGGLIGSINQKWMSQTNHTDSYKDEGYGLVDGSFKSQRESRPASISNNKLQNLTIIITSFTTFGERMSLNGNNTGKGDNKDNIAKAGFGFNNGNLEMYSQKFVGGYDVDLNKRTDIKGDFTGNSENNVTLALNQIGYNKDEYYQDLFGSQYSGNNKYVRIGTVHSLPLEHMPMLSSWYADYINLSDNYYGSPSAHTVVNLHDFKFWSQKATQSGYTNDNENFGSNGTISGGGTNYYYPMNLPYDTEIDYDNNSPKAGVFVESVTLDGKGGVGGRSVITPINVTGTDDCVMYITARNRHQFGGGTYLTGSYLPEYMLGYESELPNSIKVPTRVRNMVLRGEPYATNGILLAPNKNLHRVELENVAIYDVYKTLALYDWYNIKSQKVWPNSNAAYDALTRNDQYKSQAAEKNLPFMILRKCNLRGYTIPGPVWRYVDCYETTFERGASTGHGEEEYTYKVETTTSFNGCYFKAPFIIDMTSLPSGKTVNFTNSYATAATTGSNVKIDLAGKTGCNKVVITSEQGNPVVKYYKGSTELK